MTIPDILAGGGFRPPPLPLNFSSHLNSFTFIVKTLGRLRHEYVLQFVRISYNDLGDWKRALRVMSQNAIVIANSQKSERKRKNETSVDRRKKRTKFCPDQWGGLEEEIRGKGLEGGGIRRRSYGRGTSTRGSTYQKKLRKESESNPFNFKGAEITSNSFKISFKSIFKKKKDKRERNRM